MSALPEKIAYAVSVVLLVVAVALRPSPAAAQDLKRQVEGTWQLVSLVATGDDGQPFNAFGGNTRGMLVLDGHGRFVQILLGDFRIPFASKNRLRGTADEYKGMGKGTNAYYGAYAVDEAGKLVTFHVDSSAYSNWDRTVQKRIVAMDGDNMTFSNPSTAAGGTAVLTWKRVAR